MNEWLGCLVYFSGMVALFLFLRHVAREIKTPAWRPKRLTLGPDAQEPSSLMNGRGGFIYGPCYHARFSRN